MKICRIVHSYPPYQFGGADIFASDLTEELLRRGVAQAIITINPHGRDMFEKINGINIYRFHPLNVSTAHRIGKAGRLKQGIWSALDIYNYYSYLKIRTILQKEKPDAVHIHTPIDVTLAAFDAVKSLGLPLIFTVHDYLALCRRVVLLHGDGKICNDANVSPLCKVYRRFTRRVLENKVNIVTGPSEFTLDLYKKNSFFKNSRTIIIPHGVNLNNIGKIDKAKRPKKAAGGLDILYVGGLTRHKGVHVLINAFRQVKNPDIRLHIAGYGIFEKVLKDLAKGDNRVIFYGKVPAKEVFKLYALADALVVPSVWYEVFGRIILEAFSSGVPVICSDIGGMRELVKDGFNGLLFEPGNTEQLKGILCDVIRAPERLNLLGLNGLETVKRYGISECAGKFIEAYKEAVSISDSTRCN